MYYIRNATHLKKTLRKVFKECDDSHGITKEFINIESETHLKMLFHFQELQSRHDKMSH